MAVKYLKDVVERGPWMEGMRSGLNMALDGDYAGALVHYSRLAEVKENPSSLVDFELLCKYETWWTAVRRITIPTPSTCIWGLSCVVCGL